MQFSNDGLDRYRERWLENIELADNGCWLWTRSLNSSGYGSFFLPPDDRMSAHRASWILWRGPLDPRHDADHLCRVRPCVNYDHLEPVTRLENLLRGDTLIAQQVAVTHCPKGHPYAGHNLIVRNGKRQCRMCANAANSLRGKAKRAAIKAWDNELKTYYTHQR